MPELVTIARYRSLPEAWIAKGLLEAQGITSFIADDNIVRMNWLLADAFGGVKLQVEQQFVQTAVELLREAPPDKLPAPRGDYVQPRCPRCGSVEVRYVAVHSASYLMLFLRLPIFIRSDHWECAGCGARWKWDGPGEYDDQPAAPPHV